MSLDYPDREKWLALRSLRPNPPRMFHLSKTWKITQDASGNGRLVWNKGITYRRATYTGSECTIVSFDPVCKCKLCDCVVALPDGTERDAGTDQLRKIEDDYDGNMNPEDKRIWEAVLWSLPVNLVIWYFVLWGAW